MKSEINNSRSFRKLTNAWTLSSMFLTKLWANKEIKKYLEINENGNNTSKLMGCSKCSLKRKVYSNKYLH
jgi:hypothetical protein